MKGGARERRIGGPRADDAHRPVRRAQMEQLARWMGAAYAFLVARAGRGWKLAVRIAPGAPPLLFSLRVSASPREDSVAFLPAAASGCRRHLSRPAPGP